MEDDAAIIYGLELQARALTAQTAETEAVRFFVGTQSLKSDNQVHEIEFDDEHNRINKTVYGHRIGEVWQMSSSPRDADVLATCYSAVTMGKCEMRAAVWRLPKSKQDVAGSWSASDENSSSMPNLELLCHLNYSVDGNGSSSGGNLSETKCVQWQPGDGQRVFSLADNHIIIWDLKESSTNSAKIVNSWDVEEKSHVRMTTGTWNPHQNYTQIATANDSVIRIWDVRSQQQAFVIENAHGSLVRDLDFNPNKQYYLASCGDDCKVKFWDIRNADEPLKVMDDHSHWVWCIRYNHFHDQLVLTSSSDSRVILSNVASLSSEPFGHGVSDDVNSDSGGDDDDKESRCAAPLPAQQDHVISTYEEHEDSVYAVEWSNTDPWLFATLSYDGRVIVNRVPKAVKYKILL